MSDIQLRVQTTFDINKNDLDTQLKLLQKNTNLKLDFDISKEIQGLTELTNILKSQQKIKQETSKIKSGTVSEKEAEKLQTQTKLYERLLQLQREEFKLRQQSTSNNSRTGELEKELQLQLQINQAKQNEISGKIKDGNLVNYEMEARLLNQIDQQNQQIAIKQAQRKQKEDELNAVLQKELEMFKTQMGLQTTSIEKRYGNIKGVKENLANFNSELSKLEVRNGKLVNSMTGTQTSFKKLRQELSNIRTEARNGVGFFDRLGDSAKKFITYLGVGNVVINFANQVKQAFTYINEMNTALTNVQMITGQSAESVQGLTQEYINLGKELGMLSQDVAKVAEDYYRMGKSTEETQTLIKNTGMMATLSGMEMGNATQAMTSIMNGYKMSVEDTAHVVDTLVSIDNNAATSVEEIATALSRCSNTALEAGVSFDTLAGYAGTISSVTRKSAESIGESLKTIMVNTCLYVQKCA